MADVQEINGAWKQYGLSVRAEVVKEKGKPERTAWVAYLPNGARFGVIDQQSHLLVEVDKAFQPKQEKK